MVIEAIEDDSDDEAPTCTFDDDADPSIERCWAEDDDDDGLAFPKNLSGFGAISDGGGSDHPLALVGVGAALVAVVLIVGGILMREVKSRKHPKEGAAVGVARAVAPAENGAAARAKPAKEQPYGQQEAAAAAESGSVDARVNELRKSLEREAMEKEGLCNQNNFFYQN